MGFLSLDPAGDLGAQCSRKEERTIFFIFRRYGVVRALPKRRIHQVEHHFLASLITPVCLKGPCFPVRRQGFFIKVVIYKNFYKDLFLYKRILYS
jgi:hypothetical protein